jgi:hypothetical protein
VPLKYTSRPGFGLLSVFTCFMMVRRAEALENAENQDGRGLLNKAADQASVLDYDADQVTGLLHSDVSWQAHVTLLTAVKAHVNNLQQQAIHRSVPLLRELASNTTDAMGHPSVSSSPYWPALTSIDCKVKVISGDAWAFAQQESAGLLPSW